MATALEPGLRLRRLHPLDLDNVYASGDCMHRALRNFERLEGREFRPPDVFRGEDYPWPADMEGRTLLALVRLARATHRTPRYLEDILEELPHRLNERGYMGRILPSGTFDEQQLSGHGWLLRGLCELYEWQGDPRAAEAVDRIVKHLLLPARGYYSRYPKRPEDRDYDGGAVGSLGSKRSEHWFSSTDIGCAFILLDGATHAYALFPDPALGELIEEMIATYLSLDFRGISCQTHATLSGLRGLLRYYECAPRAELLEGARRVWSLYTAEGITANYANCNWFGRPLWNEPCGMVDAFMAGVQLWRLTGDPLPLEIAHGTYYSGLGYGQRPNGGFGCDCCPGPATPFIEPYADIFEAWWCCTMRGGEGLSRAIEYGHFADDESLVLPFYNDATVRASFPDGDLTLVQRSRYPYAGEVLLEVAASSLREAKTLHLFVPAFDGEPRLTVTVDTAPVEAPVRRGFAAVALPPKAGARIAVEFPMEARPAAPLNIRSPQDRHVFRHGPLILGCAVDDEPVSIPRDARLEPLGNAHYRVAGTDRVLSPLNDMIHRTEAQARADKRQLLFEG